MLFIVFTVFDLFIILVEANLMLNTTFKTNFPLRTLINSLDETKQNFNRTLCFSLLLNLLLGYFKQLFWLKINFNTNENKIQMVKV